MQSRLAVAAVAAAALWSAASTAAFAQAKPSIIHMDYATYNPVSLVLKDKGWLEQDLAKDGVKVDWTLSQGSNRALEFLNAGAVDFGSTAGAAALIARSNGNPIYGVYLYSKPEWTALVTLPGSGITRIQDLKGKRVAATIGTDPYIFLLRALDTAGLTDQDIQLVSLQHADGGAALVRKDVDAWAGLDPIMAKVELENHAALFYRNPDFNTYGALNVRREFADRYPSYVVRVLAAYEKARQYSRAHLPEVVSTLASVGQISREVAALQINRRTDLSTSFPGDAFVRSISAAGVVLQRGGQIKPEVDLKALVADYVNPSFARTAVAQP
ncbi:MAG TPA: aliphatic sulfonate ABC transporter substrate-binding protein [Spirochaetia bacterium]|nr:aliphatic sulfonate ABC transporter substrate-binding protein [Spirochaetia bacterium]